LCRSATEKKIVFIYLFSETNQDDTPKFNVIQDITHNVYPPERPLPCCLHQPNYHTSNRSSKTPRTTLELQVKLERTHRKKQEINGLKNKRDQLVNGEKKSHLSTENALLIYQAVIKRIW